MKLNSSKDALLCFLFGLFIVSASRGQDTGASLIIGGSGTYSDGAGGTLVINGGSSNFTGGTLNTRGTLDAGGTRNTGGTVNTRWTLNTGGELNTGGTPKTGGKT
ncbi:MAG: hypothetical protein WCI40_06370, partial [Verrucomicrobiota bacterium]